MANQVGKNIKYYDGSTWKTDRDVTEDDIKEYINLLWQDEVFPMFVDQHPEYYTEVGYFDSYIATGTASASLSGATLTTTSSIFTSSMADQKLYIYNSTDETSTYITGYTSGTEVTVNDTDISDWAGDTIYVLGSVFTFGGDATDLWTPISIGIKYSSGDVYYREAEQEVSQNLRRIGSEVGSKASPKWYNTTATVGGVLTTAVGIFPKFDEKLDDAIRVEYTAKPGDLGDANAPHLPVSLPLIDGATAWAYDQKGEETKADRYWKKYEQRLALTLATWRPDRPRKARKMRVSHGSTLRRLRLR